jgi:hypothetical protein
MTTATVNGKQASKTADPTVTPSAPTTRAANPPKAPAPPAKPLDLSTPVFDYALIRDMTGAEYLRAYECGQLLHIVTAAFREAENCASRADRAASEAEVREAIVEALACLNSGEHYARMLLDQLKWPDPRLGPAF